MTAAPRFKSPVRCAALAVVLLLAAAHGEVASAQDLAPDPYFQPMDKSFPLMPKVILRNIREDRDGNIWFASFAGPIRYDGKMFTNFGEEAGVAGQRVFSLLVDKSGALWFGTVLSGASRYDGKSFTRFTAKEGLPGNGVFQIFEDTRGDIWFGTGQGVSRYDGKTFTNYSTKDGLPDNSIQVIAQDRSGKLWFGSKLGIASYDGKTFTNFAGVAGREFQNIWSIVEDKAGNLWFGGQFGAYRYDGKTGTMLTAKDGLLDDFVGSMIVDRAGNVWFGSGGGATRYDGKAFTHFTQKEGLPSKNVSCMLEDREGRIWFGSLGDGASLYDGKTFRNFSPAPLPTKTTADPENIKSETKEIITSPGNDNENGFNTKYQYAESNDARLTILNSFPRGAPRYKDSNGKEYVYAVFSTRIINETLDPLELTIDFPLDSFEIPSSPGNHMKLLISPDPLNDEGTYKSWLNATTAFIEKNLYKPSSLKTTINPKGASTFSVVVLADRGIDGPMRAGLSLREQKLFYRVNDKEIQCGKIDLGKTCANCSAPPAEE